MADNQLYEVEKIIGKKVEPSRRVLYLVRWRNFSSEHDSWEPYANLAACKPLIDIYNKAEKETSDSPAKATDAGEAKPKSAAKMPVKKYNLKRAQSDALLSSAKKLAGNKKSISMPGRMGRPPKHLRHSTGEVKKAVKSKDKKRVTLAGTETDPPVLDLTGDSTKPTSDLTVPAGDKPSVNKKKRKNDADNDSAKSNKTKKRKKKLDLSVDTNNVSTNTPIDVHVISDDEEGEDEDDDILYSLNSDTETISLVDANTNDSKNEQNDTEASKPQKPKKKKKQKDAPTDESVEKAANPIKEKQQKKGKKKSCSLMDSKKHSKKDWISKSELFRSVSPPPVFTSVKHLMTTIDTQDPSKPSGNSLPDPVSPEASETYLADVPSSYRVAPEKLLAESEEEQPLSASSLMYRSFLDSLPEQLQASTQQTEKKHASGPSTMGGASAFSGGGGSVAGETVERRTSVRSSECAFRYKQIVVKKCFRYTQIWLNTQTVMKNALNPQVIQEVVSALNSAKYDDSHLVLFSSLGNVFCSGTDLHFLTSNDRKVAARQMADSIRDLTKTFITFPKPIIAAVSGAAVGMGVSLLALCDIVYASDKASFHLPYSQLSQTPEGASSFTLPLTLGLPSANELLYGGRKITAMEAYNLGLVSQVFWPTLMMQEVIPRAQNMATSSAKALEATKLLIRSHHRTKMELTNETECNLLLERWLSQDCQRAIETYLSNEKNITF